MSPIGEFVAGFSTEFSTDLKTFSTGKEEFSTGSNEMLGNSEFIGDKRLLSGDEWG